MGNWWGAGLLILGGSLLLLCFLQRQAVQLRVDRIVRGEDSVPREILMRRSFIERNFAPFMQLLAKVGARLTPAGQRIRIQAKLQQAGLKGTFPMRAIFAIKGLALLGNLVIICLAIVFRVPPGLVLSICIFLWLAGMLGPEKWLERQISLRRAAIARALPDTMDLLTSSVEAGLGFDAAILRISECSGKNGIELKEELARYLGDLRLGQSRQEALLALGERCNLDEMRSIVAALLQSDQVGGGVAMVLRAQGDSLRVRRRQRAQEAAMKTPVKMLFPLVLCIFPVLFIIILGPAILRLSDSMPRF